MAHTLSANKRIRQSEMRRQRNKAEKSKMKTFIKKYHKALESKDVEAAETALTTSIKLIYRAADKNVIHKNQAARRASRMVKRLNELKATK